MSNQVLLCQERRKIPEVENRLTTPWVKKKQKKKTTDRQ